MKLFITRTLSDRHGTFGKLMFENDDNGVEPMGVTCEPAPGGAHPMIPAGTYACVPHDSAEHPDTYEVTGVPGRSGILIHPGNTIRDTKGCILPGLTFGKLKVTEPDDVLPCVVSSVQAMDLLRMRLGQNNFTLTITDET